MRPVMDSYFSITFYKLALKVFAVKKPSFSFRRNIAVNILSEVNF